MKPKRLPRMPAECWPVSDFIREEMESRGWTAEQLADATRWSRATLDALMDGAALTDEQAADLGRAFEVSTKFWMSLELSYRRWALRCGSHHRHQEAERG